MRTTFLFLSVLFVFFLNTREMIAKGVSLNENTDSIAVATGDVKLILWGVKRENFDVKISQDTIFLERILFEGIEELQIQFLNDEPNNHFLEGEIIYGVKQSLRDDMGPVSLDFSYKDSIRINKTDGRYVLFPAMKNKEYLELFFDTIYFLEIKEESYTLQKNHYQYILEHQEEFKCCPEYIEQAKRFFSRNKKDFNSLADLLLEVYCKKVTIKLTDNQYLIYCDGNLW